MPGTARRSRRRSGARRGGPSPAGRQQRDPMLDSPRLTIPARRAAPVVEDVRPSEAVDDPIQRRDLVLLEQARDGSLDAFNSLVECYQDHLFALVARMVPDRDQASDAVQEAFFSAYRNMRSFRGGQRPLVAEPDRDQRRDGPAAAQEAPPVAAVSGARRRELAAAVGPAGRPCSDGDARRAVARAGRGARRRSPPTSGTRSCCSTSRATTTPRSPSSPGVSLGTVKSRIHRGRLALRDRLEGSIGLFRGEDG